MPRKNSVDVVVTQIQGDIDDTTAGLNDEEYLEALERVESHVKACIVAKKEEMGK